MPKDWRLQTKLLVAFVLIGFLSVAITGWQSYRQAKGALEDTAFNQLTAIRETKKRQIEAYFYRIRNQLGVFAENQVVVDAMQQFQSAYRELQVPGHISAQQTLAATKRLKTYYQQEFLPKLLTFDTSTPPDVNLFVPTDPAVRFLQSRYIAQNPYQIGEKDRLDTAEDNTAYSRVHARHHPLLRGYLDRFGYYDIFLIDAETGTIVYSVSKEVDYATSLLTGPYQDTNLGRVFRAARQALSASFVQMVDFEPYPPSYNAPAAFLASPIFHASQKIGVAAFQVPIEDINRVMTGDRQWQQDGLGTSGETYLIGADGTMRSDSRFLLESPEQYFATLEQRGMDADLTEAMQAANTSVLFQKVSTLAATQVLEGQTGTEIIQDYRGISVLSAYTPLRIEDVHWGIVSEIDAAEAFAPVHALRSSVRLIALGLVVVVAGLAFVLARTLTTPIRRLAQGMAAFGQGDLSERIPLSSQDEIGQLAGAFNQMADDLQQTTVSKAYVDNILTSMTDALLVVSLPSTQTPTSLEDTLIVRANPSACRLLGYPEHALIGLSFSHVIADDAESSAWLEEVLRHGQIGSREFHYRAQDGSHIPVLFSSALMRSPAHEIEGLVCVAQDLREFKALEERHHFVRETFGRYVTNDVVSSVLDQPEGLQLGGELRRVTILMSDLRGFTSLAAGLAPAQVVAFLNRYLGTMIDIILEYQGTIDEIIGDGILVIFGAPLRHDDDAQRAVACAVAMQLAMAAVNTQNQREGLPDVEMGIGIHTGDVVAGNIGSLKRTKYGVVGSPVNITGRIESYTTGGQILISEDTYREVAGLITIAGQLEVAPKGVRTTLTIYEIDGIGGRHQLFLPKTTQALQSLKPTLALRYAVLEEKQVGRTMLTGRLVKLSAQAGEIESDTQVAPLSNLKLWLTDLSGQEIGGDLYGKVVSASHSSQTRFVVRFTAQSPEVVAFLQRVLSTPPSTTPAQNQTPPPGDGGRK